MEGRSPPRGAGAEPRLSRPAIEGEVGVALCQLVLVQHSITPHFCTMYHCQVVMGKFLRNFISATLKTEFVVV